MRGVLKGSFHYSTAQHGQEINTLVENEVSDVAVKLFQKVTGLEGRALENVLFISELKTENQDFLPRHEISHIYKALGL